MTELVTTIELLQSCLKYLVLGVVQGLTEFLPISSTAHLKVFPLMMGWEDPGIAIAAILQLGSIVAVITYFRHDLQSVLKGISVAIKRGQWKTHNAQLAIALSIGTIPILLMGMAIKLFWKNFEDSIFRSIPSIALISIFMALLLGVAETIGKKSKGLSSVSGIDGFLIGLGQMLALIPGVSRSGITLSTSLIFGWKREDAARFSFLLGIPAITLAGLVELKDVFNTQIASYPSIIFPLIIGVISSAIVSWLVIDWLLKYLQKQSTWLFVIYRLIFGMTLISWWLKIPSK